MSLEAPTLTVVDKIPLGRRIEEIKREKGGYYSNVAMAGRLGIHPETLRLMLKGKREIYTFELDRIAQDLKLPVERILQEDIKIEVTELFRLLSDLSDNKRAQDIAQTFLTVAIGDTEKCDAHTYLGRVYFELRQYELSHQHRLEAYKIATYLQDKYGDTERLHETIKFLMTSFTVRKDYMNAKSLVEQVQSVFCNNPMRLGFLSYTLAMIAYNVGNLDEAKKKLLVALDSFILTNNTKEIGRAEHNVAFVDYKLGNYIQSKKMFERAIMTLENYLEPRLISEKDYVKVLMQLGENKQAAELIEKEIVVLCSIESTILEVKFHLLKALCNDDPSSAEHVLSLDTASNEHKRFACRILMKHYSLRDDAYSLLRYYKAMEEIPVHQSGVMGEEDL